MQYHNKWMITFDDENWEENSFKTFNSLEEAKNFVQEHGKQKLYLEWCEENGEDLVGEEDIVCFAGEIEYFTPKIDADGIIESLKEEAAEIGGEFSEHYLEKISKEKKQELSDMLTATFNEWAEKYNQKPTFYDVVSVKEIN